MLLTILLSIPVEAAEIILQPYLTLSEEYNDNIHLSGVNKEDDFVTSVSPGVLLDYSAPLWDWRVNAGLGYLHFAKGSRGNYIIPRISTTAKVRLIDNFLFLELFDSFTQVPLNSGYDGTFTNQANQNFLTVSPYIKFHPLERLALTTGYRYKNVMYDRPYTIDWQEHEFFLRGAHELTPRSNYFLNLAYAYTTTSNDTDYSRFTPTVGIDYLYADGSRVHLEGGYSLYFADGETLSSPYWNAGINYLFGSVVAAINGGVTFNTDPYHNASERQGVRGALTKEFPRGTIGLSPYYYTEKDQITGSSFKRSYGISAIGTYMFSDRMQGDVTVTGGREYGTTFVGPFFTGPNNDGAAYTLGRVTAGMNYLLNDGLSLFCRYNFTSYLYDGDDLSNVYNNRVTIGLTKKFEELHF